MLDISRGKKNVKMRRLVCLILLTSLISAEENKKKCKMRRLVRLISLTGIISAEETKN